MGHVADLRKPMQSDKPAQILGVMGGFIVASLARTFGGQVTLETAVGKGSTFHVELPLYGTGPADGEAGDAGLN